MYQRYYTRRFSAPRALHGGTGAYHTVVLYVDIDNTVENSWPRFKRNTHPSWPGERLDHKINLASEYMTDEPIPGAVEAINRLHAAGFIIRFLTARGGYENAFVNTRKWLDTRGFQYDDFLVVPGSANKPAVLEKACSTEHPGQICYMIDDFTHGHHKQPSECLGTNPMIYVANMFIILTLTNQPLTVNHAKPSTPTSLSA